MNAVLEAAERWSGEDERVAIATVVETKKSAPQPPGTKMAVNGSGMVTGASRVSSSRYPQPTRWPAAMASSTVAVPGSSTTP